MKLICPADKWQNAKEIGTEGADVAAHIADALGLAKTYANGKLYLDLPDKMRAVKDSVPVFHDNVLRFTMRLPKAPSSEIIDGVITLNGKMYKACSGCVGGQIYGSYWVTAQSPIPPGDIYHLDLRWTKSELTGINGRFYHILPDPIYRADGKAQRSEIGLHQDNGVPGTAGCIGVVGQDWRRLKTELDRLARSNRYLRLEVSYLCRD